MPESTLIDFAKIYAAPLEERQRISAEEYQKAFESARIQNELRYTKGLEGYEALFASSSGLLDMLGGQSKRDIAQRSREAQSQATQRLVSSGLSGSTAMASSIGGIKGRETDALVRLNEALAQQRLATLNPITQGQLDFMERREDVYPDAAMFQSLIQGFSQEAADLREDERLRQEAEDAKRSTVDTRTRIPEWELLGFSSFAEYDAHQKSLPRTYDPFY